MRNKYKIPIYTALLASAASFGTAVYYSFYGFEKYKIPGSYVPLPIDLSIEYTSVTRRGDVVNTQDKSIMMKKPLEFLKPSDFRYHMYKELVSKPLKWIKITYKKLDGTPLADAQIQKILAAQTDFSKKTELSSELLAMNGYIIVHHIPTLDGKVAIKETLVHFRDTIDNIIADPNLPEFKVHYDGDPSLVEILTADATHIMLKAPLELEKADHFGYALVTNGVSSAISDESPVNITYMDFNGEKVIPEADLAKFIQAVKTHNPQGLNPLLLKNVGYQVVHEYTDGSNNTYKVMTMVDYPGHITGEQWVKDSKHGYVETSKAIRAIVKVDPNLADSSKHEASLIDSMADMSKASELLMEKGFGVKVNEQNMQETMLTLMMLRFVQPYDLINARNFWNQWYGDKIQFKGAGVFNDFAFTPETRMMTKMFLPVFNSISNNKSNVWTMDVSDGKGGTVKVPVIFPSFNFERNAVVLSTFNDDTKIHDKTIHEWYPRLVQWLSDNGQKDPTWTESVPSDGYFTLDEWKLFAKRFYQYEWVLTNGNVTGWQKNPKTSSASDLEKFVNKKLYEKVLNRQLAEMQGDDIVGSGVSIEIPLTRDETKPKFILDINENELKTTPFSWTFDLTKTSPERSNIQHISLTSSQLSEFAKLVNSGQNLLDNTQDNILVKNPTQADDPLSSGATYAQEISGLYQGWDVQGNTDKWSKTREAFNFSDIFYGNFMTDPKYAMLSEIFKDAVSLFIQNAKDGDTIKTLVEYIMEKVYTHKDYEKIGLKFEVIPNPNIFETGDLQGIDYDSYQTSLPHVLNLKEILQRVSTSLLKDALKNYSKNYTNSANVKPFETFQDIKTYANAIDKDTLKHDLIWIKDMEGVTAAEFAKLMAGIDAQPSVEAAIKYVLYGYIFNHKEKMAGHQYYFDGIVDPSADPDGAFYTNQATASDVMTPKISVSAGGQHKSYTWNAIFKSFNISVLVNMNEDLLKMIGGKWSSLIILMQNAPVIGQFSSIDSNWDTLKQNPPNESKPASTMEVN